MSELLENRPIVAANWKMHPESLRDAKRLFSDVKRTASYLKNTTTVLCAPGLFLGAMLDNYRGSKIYLGAEDVSIFSGTASQTGEISAQMLSDSGADVTIVGHSERRAMGETTEQTREKVKRAVMADLAVILCIGEKERDDGGDFLSVLRSQIADVFSYVPARFHSRITIAYEPLWAIGGNSNSAVTPHILHQTVLFIKKVLRQQISEQKADKISILYGGSVKRTNAETLYEGTEVDGFLVGSASLDADHFCDILRALNDFEANEN